jgi:NAD(P)-dependent dehydrogenase (short-subunit alcohol dehydrogenase family)
MTDGRDEERAMSLSSPIGGKTVVVTGAARGIGEQLALTLAGRGARVALLGLEPERLADVAGRCGANAAWWEADVTDAERLAAVAKEVADRFSRVDAVVANAGIASGGPVLLADPTSFDRVIEVNLLGSVRTARAFLPALVASRGYYLQIASAAAFVPAPMMAAYCASKSGVEAFAHSMRTEVAHHGVDVGVAYLSWTDTDMVRGGDAVLGGQRQQLPWPMGATGRLEPAVERLADGIERRSPHVYGQRHVRVLPLLRGLLPGLVYRSGRREAADGERIILESGVEATLPVGAGGRADTAARSGHDG